MTFEVRAVREDEKEECLALWKTVFAFEGSDAYFRRYFEGDVDWIPDYTRVGVLNGKIISAVQIVKRTVSMPDFTLTLGGIANVATLPEFRGNGYNSDCLRSALSVMEADALDFSLLFTGIPDYYRKFGFAPLLLRSLLGTLLPNLPLPPTSLSVRPAVPADLPALRDLYARYNEHRPLAVRRTEAYWRDWIGIEKPGAQDGILIASADTGTKRERPVGSVWAADRLRFADGSVTSPEEFTLHEFAALPEFAPEAALILIATAADWARRHGAVRLRLELPETAEVTAAWHTVTENPEVQDSSSAMVRLLNRSSLLSDLALMKLEAYLAQNARNRTEVASLIVETPYGNTQVLAEPTRLTVRETDTPAQVSQKAFFAALFGVSPLPTQTSPGILPALLFPGGACHYGTKDGF